MQSRGYIESLPHSNPANWQDYGSYENMYVIIEQSAWLPTIVGIEPFRYHLVLLNIGPLEQSNK